jgi:biopolymer transport protein TolR
MSQSMTLLRDSRDDQSDAMKVANLQNKYQILAEINMIPFIDVALVLLIIFMVMTPFLVKSQIKINIPKSKTGESTAKQDKTVDVQIQSNGNILMDGKRIPVESLEATLTSRLGNPADQTVMIEADKDVAFEHVVLVMSTAKKIGVAKLGVCVMADKVQPPKKTKRLDFAPIR